MADELQDAKKLLESISFFNTYVAKERGVDESAREIAERRRREALLDKMAQQPAARLLEVTHMYVAI